MNFNDIIFLDFETTSANPHRTQPIQLAAICIDGRKLEIREGSLFSSYIQPLYDEKDCSKYCVDALTDEASAKNGITLDMIKNERPAKLVWKQFAQYVQNFNPTKNKWKAPIKAGFNIDNFDSIIIDRLCGGNQRAAKNAIDNMAKLGIVSEIPKIPELYSFGPWDEKNNEETLFKPRDSIDLMRIVWLWTENMQDITSTSMDAVRDWLGISREGAHNAVKDVIDGANILIKFMKLHRTCATKYKFRGSMNETSLQI